MPARVTKKDLRAALVEAEWNKSKAAAQLGIHRATVDKLMKQYSVVLPKSMRVEFTKKEIIRALEAFEYNKSQAAQRLGIHRATLGKLMKQHDIEPPTDDGKDEPVLVGSIEVETKRVKKGVPRRGIRRYILTSAQNNTLVHPAVWQSLLALAAHYDAEIMVSRYTYNKSAFGRKAVKPGTHNPEGNELWYDEAISNYVVDHSVQLAPGIIFCGEMNILPTAVRPLSGFDSYNGRNSSVFPHPKHAMVSIATAKGMGVKFNYTTGTVTQRNYIQKKEGLKAQFHHVYGAVIVEVNSKGNWWVRQLNATDDGEIYDLDVRVDPDGTITTGNSVEAITWGDIHHAFLDEGVAATAWGTGGMLDTLKPKFQFFHDVLDFRSRMHHDSHNPHQNFWKYANGIDDAKKEVAGVAQFLQETRREWCKSVVCDSNHDNMLNRWLREGDYKEDPKNAVFFLECQLRMYRALEEDEALNYHLLEDILCEMGVDGVRFLRADESFIICPDHSGGIECGMHGHLGANGARGRPLQFTKMGRRANTGHTHSAGIIDGVCTAGLCGQLQMVYNMGPSSWSHTQIVTYPNGKRTLCTYWNGLWRA